jgi:hypothetical protein
MKLFNLMSEVGQHSIDQGCSKDVFGNMQAG